jgi:hypothetical protein
VMLPCATSQALYPGSCTQKNEEPHCQCRRDSRGRGQHRRPTRGPGRRYRPLTWGLRCQGHQSSMVMISWWCGGGHKVKGAAAPAGPQSGTLELGDAGAGHWPPACAADPAGQALPGKLTIGSTRLEPISSNDRIGRVTSHSAGLTRPVTMIAHSRGRRARVAGSSSESAMLQPWDQTDLRRPGSDEPVATRPAGWRGLVLWCSSWATLP